MNVTPQQLHFLPFTELNGFDFATSCTSLPTDLSLAYPEITEEIVYYNISCCPKNISWNMWCLYFGCWPSSTSVHLLLSGFPLLYVLFRSSFHFDDHVSYHMLHYHQSITSSLFLQSEPYLCHVLSPPHSTLLVCKVIMSALISCCSVFSYLCLFL